MHLFKPTASRYMTTWASFIYFKLGCVPIWPTKNIVIGTMPECVKDMYPNTRVTFVCTELFCRKPSSLTIQSSFFSHYKHHITYKGLGWFPQLKQQHLLVSFILPLHLMLKILLKDIAFSTKNFLLRQREFMQKELFNALSIFDKFAARCI